MPRSWAMRTEVDDEVRAALASWRPKLLGAPFASASVILLRLFYAAVK
jgi:hypothetical protein